MLVYALSYLDGKEHSGERRWELFRQLRLWSYISPIQYFFADLNALALVKHSKRIYILIPGETMASLVWGLGLHGGRLPFATKLHYIVPPIFMWIPLVRDVLLWTGAVSAKRYKNKTTEENVTELMLELLQDSRSVCYCPSLLFHDATAGDVEMNCTLPTELLEFALKEKAQLVPIIVQNEMRRYHFLKWKRMQQFFQRWLEYPFPFLPVFRFFGNKRPPKLQMNFGPIIHCDEKYSNVEVLRKHFGTTVESMVCREAGDLPIKF